ncbi:hypothetical protein Y032_0246g22 [Ancylostoma ceylanicum]|uniref:Uncharacterized protein n=1 Tax=Ancylostoma ceylanicum TaxID=53326 RepID=A0A016SDQ0_9BILA|nr:hypothetical protein Y032_0246g22 [Ancylostoma ceylanicum]
MAELPRLKPDFFTALGPSPGNRHMFFTKGSPTTSDAWRCLTCQLANCSFQSNQISTDFKRILTWCKTKVISERKAQNTNTDDDSNTRPIS